MKKALLYLVLFLAVNILFGLAFNGVLTLIYGKDHVTTPMEMVVLTALIEVVLAALFLLLKWYPVSRDYVRSRPWATLLWTLTLAVGIILPLAWLESFLPEAMRKDLTGDMLYHILDSTEGYFVICMLAPLTEELIFRGAMIRSLVEWGRKIRQKHVDNGKSAAYSALSDSKIEWTAILISAFFFSLAHANPAQMPHALIIGTLLGWLYVKTGSILPCFILHWVNNSSAYVVIKLFPNLPSDAPLIDYFHGSQHAMSQALLSSLLIALPALYQLIRLKRRDY